MTKWVGDFVGRRPRFAADLTFSVGLVVLVAAAYSPALKHGPRSDQWCYLIDTAHCGTFPHLLNESYSFNRTRTIGAGDTELFRPVLFALLATEKHVFEGDFRYHQGVGVGLHCLVCLLLLALLRQIQAVAPESDPARAGWPPAVLLPYGVTAFFALSPCVQELVIWHHLHGYLLFLVLLLGSFLCLLRFAAGPPVLWWRSRLLWAAWGLAAAAAFTYELGQAYAVLAGLFAATTSRTLASRRATAGAFAAFCMIAMVYQGTNALDRQIHAGRYDPDGGNTQVIRERAFTPATVENSGRFAAYTLAQPFFPSQMRPEFLCERVVVWESLWEGRGFRAFSPALVVSYATLAAASILAAVGFWRLARFEKGNLPQVPPATPSLLERGNLPQVPPATPSRRRAGVSGLTFLTAAGLYAAYAGITVLGRMNVRPGPVGLPGNSYYAYFGLLFGLLALATAWQVAGRDAGWVGILRVGLLVGLVALSLPGAEVVRRTTADVAQASRGTTTPLRAVQAFVAAHRDEQGFSFAIDYTSSDPIPQKFGVPVTDIVFARWIDATEPRYRVVIRGDWCGPR